MPKKNPWDATDVAKDTDANPMRRTGSLTYEHQIAHYNDIRVGGLIIDPEGQWALGYLQTNLGGEYELPPSSPAAPYGSREVRKSPLRVHPAMPEMPGAE